MEQRRVFLFITLSVAVLLVWTNFVIPRFFPPPARPIAQQPAAEDADDPQAGADDAEPQAAQDAQAPPVVVEAPKHPERPVVLGSLDPASGYFLQVELTTRGAAVEKVLLNDPRFKELADAGRALAVVGDAPGELTTFETNVPAIDRQLRNADLASVNWEVVRGSESPSGVTFRYVSPDGTLEVLKRYELPRIPNSEKIVVRDENAKGYQLALKLTLRNLGEESQKVQYVLQGPVGVPLENLENLQKYRDIRVGFLEEGGGVRSEQMTSAELLEAVDKNEVETWKRPFKYLGVDVQYFAALLLPGGDQLQEPYVEEVRPVVVTRDKKNEVESDVSVQIVSQELALKPGAEVTHAWNLFTGPKRQELLEPLSAVDTVDLGWFALLVQGMLWLLHSLHDVGFPYWMAIIMLTIIVRGCLFPISRRQAMNVKKMKEIQPKLQELKKKHGSNREAMARAQMELFSKHNYNPLAGCIPLLFQFPIFISLYRALSVSIDLRRAEFLWIDNLAAPDQLFELPFVVPFLGWTHFNLLPLITVGLFIAQQKMYMPPPTDKEQELQYKMMNFMMIIIGVMFYKVPAGLCLYFIASSLWGMGERKMLDWQVKKKPIEELPPQDTGPKKKNYFAAMMERLAEAADKAGSQTGQTPSRPEGKPAGKSKKRSRSR